jgi:hypothetical protein
MNRGILRDGYEGGENIYNFSGKAIRVSLLTTENGQLHPTMIVTQNLKISSQ